MSTTDVFRGYSIQNYIAIYLSLIKMNESPDFMFCTVEPFHSQKHNKYAEPDILLQYANASELIQVKTSEKSFQKQDILTFLDGITKNNDNNNNFLLYLVHKNNLSELTNDIIDAINGSKNALNLVTERKSINKRHKDTIVEYSNQQNVLINTTFLNYDFIVNSIIIQLQIWSSSELKISLTNLQATIFLNNMLSKIVELSLNNEKDLTLTKQTFMNEVLNVSNIKNELEDKTLLYNKVSFDLYEKIRLLNPKEALDKMNEILNQTFKLSSNYKYIYHFSNDSITICANGFLNGVFDGPVNGKLEFTKENRKRLEYNLLYGNNFQITAENISSFDNENNLLFYSKNQLLSFISNKEKTPYLELIFSNLKLPMYFKDIIEDDIIIESNHPNIYMQMRISSPNKKEISFSIRHHEHRITTKYFYLYNDITKTILNEGLKIIKEDAVFNISKFDSLNFLDFEPEFYYYLNKIDEIQSKLNKTLFLPEEISDDFFHSVNYLHKAFENGLRVSFPDNIKTSLIINKDTVEDILSKIIHKGFVEDVVLRTLKADTLFDNSFNYIEEIPFPSLEIKDFEVFKKFLFNSLDIVKNSVADIRYSLELIPPKDTVLFYKPNKDFLLNNKKTFLN